LLQIRGPIEPDSDDNLISVIRLNSQWSELENGHKIGSSPHAHLARAVRRV
jgi:hypothetical protein